MGLNTLIRSCPNQIHCDHDLPEPLKTSVLSPTALVSSSFFCRLREEGRVSSLLYLSFMSFYLFVLVCFLVFLALFTSLEVLSIVLYDLSHLELHFQSLSFSSAPPLLSLQKNQTLLTCKN